MAKTLPDTATSTAGKDTVAAPPNQASDTNGQEEDSMTMVYAMGEGCINGKQRQVFMRVECGNKNEIVSVVEDGMCEYEMTFSSPAACRKGDAVEGQSSQ